MDEETNASLHRQLVKLGDMMGDGLHEEPGGNWITRDYRRVAKALGYPVGQQRRANNSQAINEGMAVRVKEFKCHCGGEVKQTRSGSKRARCTSCQALWKLLK